MKLWKVWISVIFVVLVLAPVQESATSIHPSKILNLKKVFLIFSLRYFKIQVGGPPGTSYEGGIFHLELFLPENYPMEPPKVRFLTKIYHPNIDKLGRICLDILKDKWTPALQIRTVLISIQALLSCPNPDDPLDESVADHFKSNLNEANAKAQDW